MGEGMDWGALVTVLAGIDWTTVLVALVTGGTAAGGPVWVAYRQAKRERESVRAALLTEVAVLVELIQLRGYLVGLRETQASLEGMSEEQRKTLRECSYSINVSEHYNRVYQANVSKIGEIPQKEATQIVRFHQMADSVIADVGPGGVLSTRNVNPGAYREAADIVEEMLRIGKELTKGFPAPKQQLTKD